MVVDAGSKPSADNLDIVVETVEEESDEDADAKSPPPEAEDTKSKAGADSESVDTPTISNKDKAPGVVIQTPKHDEWEDETKG